MLAQDAGGGPEGTMLSRMQRDDRAIPTSKRAQLAKSIRFRYLWLIARNAMLASLALNMRTGKAYTAAQMASYLYKYVSKNLSGAEFNKKCYWLSQNIAPPVRIVRLFRTYSEAFSATLEHFQAFGLPFVQNGIVVGVMRVLMCSG